MTRATYSATPLLRSLVFRPQGVILVYNVKKETLKSKMSGDASSLIFRLRGRPRLPLSVPMNIAFPAREIPPTLPGGLISDQTVTSSARLHAAPPAVPSRHPASGTAVLHAKRQHRYLILFVWLTDLDRFCLSAPWLLSARYLERR